jgi:hypothetical protein
MARQFESRHPRLALTRRVAVDERHSQLDVGAREDAVRDLGLHGPGVHATPLTLQAHGGELELEGVPLGGVRILHLVGSAAIGVVVVGLGAERRGAEHGERQRKRRRSCAAWKSER